MSEFTEGNGNVATGDPPNPRSGDGGPHEAFARVKEPPPRVNKKPFFKRPVVLIVLAIVVFGGIAGGLIWWLEARNWETTDDAFIEADVTQVSPRVAGHVQNVLVTDNQSVEQNQKLVELDPRDQQMKVNESRAAVASEEAILQQSRDSASIAEADVGQAQAAQLAAQTEADRAQSELQRFQSLSAEAVTQQQIINLKAAAASADAQLEAARQKTRSSQAHVKYAQSQIQVSQAQVDQTRAALSDAELQLSYTVVAASIAGHVTNRSVRPGDYVQLGQAMIGLVPHEVYVIANYKETQLDQIRPGQSVDLRVDAYPGHTFHGKVDSIQRGSGAAFSLLPPENATGNYVKVVQRVPVKITFDSEGYALGPGMSVLPKVRIR